MSESVICPLCKKDIIEEDTHITLTVNKEFNEGDGVRVLNSLVLAKYHVDCFKEMQNFLKLNL